MGRSLNVCRKLPFGPKVAMATGQVLFQRFYYSKSFVKHSMETVAMACINGASKIEESPRRIRDVINVFHHIKQVRDGKTITPMPLDQNYINLKNQVIKAERRLLKELGFCVHVKHPHKIIVMYLQVLESHTNQRLAQMSWNYMNDSFRTNVFVRFKPEAIACACIYLAARKLQIPLPKNPGWYLLFGFEEPELQDISLSILQLYGRPKPNLEAIDKAVNECKKLHIEAKLKARAVTGNFTPNSNSRPPTPSKVSPSPLLVSTVKKLKSEDDHSDHSSFGCRLDNHVSRKKRSRTRSRSRSSRSHSGARSYSSRGSRSPPSPHHSQSPPPKHSKKESRDKKYYSSKDRDKDYVEIYDREYYRQSGRDRVRDRDHDSSGKHKRRRHTPTYSPTYSASPEPRSKTHKKYYKEKERERYRSRSRERDPDRHRSSKKRNGHHRSGSRDHYRR